jgi:hypothetical protein
LYNLVVMFLLDGNYIHDFISGFNFILFYIL